MHDALRHVDRSAFMPYLERNLREPGGPVNPEAALQAQLERLQLKL